MARLPSLLRAAAVVTLLPLIPAQSAFAWGHYGHEMINRLAAEKLPADVPAFLRSPAALDAMEFYSPEPDRWRSLAEPDLSAVVAPDHFIDMEWSDLVGNPLPRRRYDFIRALAYAQKSHPDMALSPEKVGLLPYAIDEGYEKLKNDMRWYRGLVAQHKDTRAAEAEIVYLAGILGHFVGDGSQPLHATMQFNGWTGPNPNGYTTDKGFHSKFESDFVNSTVKAERDLAPLVPAAPVVSSDVFADTMTYLHRSNSFVEPVYQLEKAHAFDGSGTPEGRKLVNERLAAGATELRDLIYTAWVKSADPVPSYRNSQPVKPESE
ncbi:nuclease [Granulicella sp. WH15]|uniref:S1/P1 nuclease n=1 Tax=Granulicella sp. WH15 TaxID=2602070 RepID=UPI001366F173|nr:S1/P1 nuclease [Granulicella sp. WH15]QHN04609.1 nuclease [Granulicella sp. WH15]